MEQKRSPEEAKRLEDMVRRMGPIQFFALMQRRFGLKRTLELIGWLCYWEFQGVDSISELRIKLQEKGMSQAAAYKAAKDLKDFGDEILKASPDLELDSLQDEEIIRIVRLMGSQKQEIAV